MDAQIVIIGGGPAGSIAAALLARARIAVTLIEQHQFPRDKVCGECVSSVGIDVLDRLGALDRLPGAVTLHRCLVHAPSGASVDLPLPRSMIGISRQLLDSTLLQLAAESGAQVVQPARCERIEPMLDHADVLTRDLVTNRVDRIAAEVVLVADGKGALPAMRRNATPDMGIKAHFAHIRAPRDAIELFGVRGSYGGLAPIEDRTWNASFSVPADLIREHRGDLDSVFACLTGENRTLRHRMRDAIRVSAWLASPLPRFGLRDLDSSCIIPIGNAAAAIEPIGGEGMGLAMCSAELAARAVIDAMQMQRCVDILWLQREYKRLWQTRRSACRTAALIISRPALANWLLDGIDGHRMLSQAMLRWLGKSPAIAVTSGK